MKAVYIEKPFDLKIADIPAPQVRNPDDVKIRILCGSICGSDVGIYNGRNSLATYPRIIGHEFGGIVEAVGTGVTKVKPGDYVAVDPVRSCGHCYACTHGHHNVCSALEVAGVHRDGGFCEYAVAPEIAVYPVDTTKISPEFLCFVEPYSIGAEVNNRAAVTAGDTVLVMGSGPIGLAVMQFAKERGAKVMMTDILDPRLERAKAMGADIAINTNVMDLKQAVMDLTHGEGMPVIVDTICAAWSFELAISLSCPAGRIVTLGTNNQTSSIAQVDITKKELTIVGSRLSNYRFPEVIALLEAGKLNPEKMRTSVFPYTQAREALECVMEHADTECKVVLSFAENSFSAN